MPFKKGGKATSSKDTKNVEAGTNRIKISEIPSASGGGAASSFVFKNGKIIFMPVSVGIELQGKVMNIVMEKGRSLPSSSTLYITTPTDYQYSVTLKVFIGERPSTRDNYFVGEMQVKGLSYKQQRRIKIKIIISVNEDGILTAEAEEDVEGNSATVDEWERLDMTKATLPQVNLLLLENQIKSLLAETNLPSNVKADKIEKERVKAKNELEQIAAKFKETLQAPDLEDRLSADADMKATLFMANELLEWLRCNQYVPAKYYAKMTWSLLEAGAPIIEQLKSENLISSGGGVKVEHNSCMKIEVV